MKLIRKDGARSRNRSLNYTHLGKLEVLLLVNRAVNPTAKFYADGCFIGQMKLDRVSEQRSFHCFR